MRIAFVRACVCACMHLRACVCAFVRAIMCIREATRGSSLLSVIGIKTTPNSKMFSSNWDSVFVDKIPTAKYNGLTRQCQGSVRAHS